MRPSDANEDVEATNRSAAASGTPAAAPATPGAAAPPGAQFAPPGFGGASQPTEPAADATDPDLRAAAAPAAGLRLRSAASAARIVRSACPAGLRPARHAELRSAEPAGTATGRDTPSLAMASSNPPPWAAGAQPPQPPRDAGPIKAAFDLSFNSWATPGLVKIVYIVGIVLVAVSYVISVISMFVAGLPRDYGFGVESEGTRRPRHPHAGVRSDPRSVLHPAAASRSGAGALERADGDRHPRAANAQRLRREGLSGAGRRPQWRPAGPPATAELAASGRSIGFAALPTTAARLAQPAAHRDRERCRGGGIEHQVGGDLADEHGDAVGRDHREREPDRRRRTISESSSSAGPNSAISSTSVRRRGRAAPARLCSACTPSASDAVEADARDDRRHDREHRSRPRPRGRQPRAQQPRPPTRPRQAGIGAARTARANGGCRRARGEVPPSSPWWAGAKRPTR